jgi:hypothetical protein
MADHKDKLKHHKLLLELKFLYVDLEYHKTVLDDAGRDFQKELTKKFENDSELNISAQPQASEASEVQKAPSEEKSDIISVEKGSMDKDVSDLYKKIVKVTHPDKLVSLSKEEKGYKRGLFLKASEAAEENKLFALQQIAMDLGIDIGTLSDEQVKILEQESKKLKQEIKQMTGSFAWVWYNEESEEVKDHLITKYGDILKSLSRGAGDSEEKE